ncbi:MAG: NAD-dependent epimerase/dehydratase family protein [Planctomycetota bacterium]|jgi:nucleoside-diphosphate-sugar epimerase|nr:NAD-dependent epimerase/dehydratase family protein [Planctomycetota bacterium]
MTRVLITGGGGFLGRHLIAKLRARPDYQIRAFGRRAYPDLTALGVETVVGDLADAAALTAAVRGVDAVFHVAAKVGVVGRYGEYYQTNVGGTRNLLAACRAAGVKKLVYTSTPSVVFGNANLRNGDEKLPYARRCLTVYAQTKIEAEKLVLAANDDILTCALRPHLIWGPGDTNLIPHLIAKAQTGRLAQIGNGKNLISVSYVENTADAHLAALDALGVNPAVAGSAYFINEPEPVNCWDFIRRVLRALNLPEITFKLPYRAAYALGALMEVGEFLFPAWEPPMTRFLALQLAKDHCFSIARARRDLGWEPRVGIDEGIRRLTAPNGGKR